MANDPVSRLKIRYRPVRTYDVAELNHPGAQVVAGRRGWWASPAVPADFLDVNSLALHGGHLASVVSGATRELKVRQVDTGLAIAGFAHTFTGGTGLTCVEADPTWLYVGGDYTAVDAVTTIAGRPVRGLVRFDYNGTLDTTWNPAPNAAADAVQLLRYNPANDTLYIAGSGLTTLNGTGRTRLGEVSLGDAGNATAWNPAPDGAVTAIAVDVAGARVYLGGAFANLYAAAHVRLGRLTMTGAGTADAWAPAPNGQVHAIVLHNGLVYCGGAFTTIGTGATARNRAATVNPDGTAGAWNPNSSGTVKSLALYGAVVFLGGSFATVGGTGRVNLAAVTDGAGALLAWNPGANAQVAQVLALDRTLYVAGSFTTLNGVVVTALGAVPYPIFTDTNTKYVAKTGSDAAAGTSAAPYLTITKALSTLTAAFTFVVIKDSGTYTEQLAIAYAANEAGGLFAADGQAPTISYPVGATKGTFGARRTGRTKFSTGAGATFFYVSKAGNDGTGTRGDSTKPFLTISAALAAGSRLANDTIQIEDDGFYVENLNAAALAVTIQAKDGKMPTLRSASLATSHVRANGNVAVALYGLLFDNPPSTSTTVGCINTQGSVTMYDCSVVGHGLQVYFTGGGTRSLDVTNCYFGNGQHAAITVEGATWQSMAITNCWVQDCNITGTFSPGSIDIRVRGTQRMGTVDKLTIVHPFPNGIYIQGYDTTAGGFPMSRVDITRLEIIGNRNAPSRAHGVAVSADNTLPYVLLDVRVTAAVISDLWLAAIWDNVPLKFSSRQYTDVLAMRCSQTSDPVTVFLNEDGTFTSRIVGPSNGTGTFMGANFTNCTAIDGGGCGFLMLFGAGIIASPGPSVPGGVTYDRCVVVNNSALGAGAPDGFALKGDFNQSQLFNPTPFVNITNCIAQGLGRYGVVSYSLTGSSTPALPAVTITQSIIDKPLFISPNTFAMTITLGASAYINVSPRIVNVSRNSENIALGYQSPALFLGSDGAPVGHRAELVVVNSLTQDFRLDGLILSSEVNRYAGVRCVRPLAAIARIGWCTLDGLGCYGALLTSAAELEECVLTTNGPGVLLFDVACKSQRSVAYGCPDAAFVLASSSALSRHLTVAQSGVGQADIEPNIGLLSSDNVLALNGLDYAGTGDQATSDVETIEDGATVTSGIRSNPQFRDVRAPDLRLQAIAVGSFRNSPALGLASDGTDAGAYDEYRGPLAEDWTVLDFGTAGWWNPDNVDHEEVPAHLISQVTFGLKQTSDAAGFLDKMTLRWGPQHPMADDQAAALIDLYTFGVGECQVSEDGGTTWSPRQVDRSLGLSRSQLEGLFYSRDGVPEPVRAIALLETA